MVSTASIVFMIFTILVCFLLPVGLVVYFYRKEKISMKAVMTGVLVFIVSQLAIRVQILNYLSGQEWYEALAANLFLIAGILSLSAGVFEEIGRYLGFKYLVKDELERKNGIAFGIGHGGIEAMFLVGLTYVNNLSLSFMINAGTYDSYIRPQVGPMADSIKNSLINLSPLFFAAAGVERIFVIIIHIALSLVVLYGVMQGRFRYVIYAVFLHTLVNFIPVIMRGTGLDIWLVEAYLLIVAVIALVFISKSKEFFPERIENKVE